MSWDRETAHQRFWRSLLNTRLDSLLANKDELRSLRYNWKTFRYLKDKLRTVLKERGLSLTRCVSEAYGDTWDSDQDSEDDEKGSPDYQKSSHHEVKQIPNAVSLGPTRKIGVCEGEIQGDVVQTSDDCRKVFVQKEGLQEGGEEGGGLLPAKEEGAKKKKLKKAASEEKQSDAGIEGGKPEPKKKKRVRKRPMLGGKFKNIN